MYLIHRTELENLADGACHYVMSREAQGLPDEPR